MLATEIFERESGTPTPAGYAAFAAQVGGKHFPSDRAQFEWLDARIPGGRPEGYTWHHTETPGRMELVPFGEHNITNHVGGRSPGHWAHVPR